MSPRTDGLLESALYVSDLPASLSFYQRLFGFPLIADFNPRGCALQAGPHQVLLLFTKRASLDMNTPHDGDGQLHVAFAVSREELPRWFDWLAENNIPIEEDTTWPRGGRSLYFRDPDHHLLELATPGVWTCY